MKTLLLFITLFTLSGCMDFGSDYETAHPTKENKEQLLSFFNIKDPKGSMIVYGIDFVGSGQDDCMTAKIECDMATFPQAKEDSTPTKPSNVKKWWDIEGKPGKWHTYNIGNRSAYVFIVPKDKDRIFAYLYSFEL
jgi:hypothetical protein